MAMNVLGNGLSDAKHQEDALSVKEAELALMRRVGASERHILVAQGNLANTYAELGRLEEALSMRQDVHAGNLKLYGEEHAATLQEADNYANDLLRLQRFEEARSLLRKTMPVARRVLGESNEITLRVRSLYAQALYRDEGATLDDLREAVATLEEIERTTRRVLGAAHPTTTIIAHHFRAARAALAARETPPPGSG